ncbi:MAG: hypothetical protein RL297_1708 [Pseudomonadota bacterium]
MLERNMTLDPHAHDPYLQELTAVTNAWARRARQLFTVAAAMAMVVGVVAAPARASEAHATAADWTPATLRKALSDLPQGDAERGRVLNQQMFCASCHGNTGVAPTQNWPHLAGQKAAYTAKMLLDYRDRRHRPNQGAELMHDLAVMMTPQHIADVSAFYAAQKAPQDDGTPRPATKLNPEQLVRKGDPSRLITPCASCHSTRGQGGKFEAPALAGQNPLYFVRTMLDYQTGHRTNDAAQGMRTFAKRLSREEIEALATYYADLPTQR